MTRMRTHKKQFTTISNASIRDRNLSLEGIGLLAVCLSMPEQWDFYPKQMWKAGYCSRDKLYKIFNELIESGHCLRIKTPNPKMLHLPGEVQYEIFDDIEDCKKRYNELKNEKLFIECSSDFKEFKKFYRLPNSQDPNITDPLIQDVIKKEERKKDIINPPLSSPTQKETLPKKPALKKQSLRSEEEDSLAFLFLEGTTLSPKDKLRLRKHYDPEDVKRALKISERQPIKKSLIALLIHILDNPDKWNETSEDKPVTPQEKLALSYNLKLDKIAPKLAEENESNIPKGYIKVIVNGAVAQLSLKAYDFESEVKKLLKLQDKKT